MVEVQAQLAVGSWKTYASFASVDKVVDTPHMVYYITNGQLYSRDKDNDETYNYTAGNKLSESNVSNIFYNYDKNYLFIVYSNGNTDIIDSDGRVYNMPDIMDASLDVVPVINDVDFDGDRIYVATNFGVVVFDYKKKEVVTAGDYGRNMTSVMVLGDNLWLVEGYIYYNSNKNRNLTSSTSIQRHEFAYTTDKLMKLGDDKIVIMGDEGKKLVVCNYISQDSKIVIISERSTAGLKNIQRLTDGRLMCHTYDSIYIIDTDGNIDVTSVAGTDMEIKKVGSMYETKQIASCKGLDKLWLGSDAGLSCYSIKDGGLTVLSEPARPDNALTFSIIGRLYKGPSGAIYASSHGFSHLIGEAVNPGNSSDNLFYINKLYNGDIIDLTPKIGEFEVRPANSKGNKSLTMEPKGFRSGYQVLEDPNDAEAYIVGSFYDGYYRFKKGEGTIQYDGSNSTLKSILNGYRMQANGMDIDEHGNLWVSQYLYEADDSYRQFHMLQADKVGTETTANDWQSVKDVTFADETGHDGNLLACRHSNNVIYYDGRYIPPISIIKTKGTLSTSDDLLVMGSELIDQDGNAFSYNYIYSAIEDMKGRVWFGTDNGVIEITRPDDMNNSRFDINHLKVPRKDGTNFADYLLNGEEVCAMAVDPSNRKWLATLKSGVYLVSENGDEILEHFDPANSPLPSYSVFAVACDDNNNVFFGTQNGLYQYSSMSAPAREDFSEVYAYPNPVRPDYTGWITITGLMENSLVKIADAAGNVFYQSTSEGGMLVWDGCDRQGRRVKTGVYYVFASHGGEGQETNGAVTKILVVN